MTDEDIASLRATMKEILKSSVLPQELDDYAQNQLTRSQSDVKRALAHRRWHILQQYQNRVAYRTIVVNAWVKFSSPAISSRSKQEHAKDNDPESAKRDNVATRLSLYRIIHEVNESDNDTFRAIWETLRSGLTSMVSHNQPEFDLLRKLLGTDMSDEDLVSEAGVPFISAQEYNKRRQQEVATGTKDAELMLIGKDSMYTTHFGQLSKFRQLSKHVLKNYTDNFIELIAYRKRVTNKIGCFLSLLKKVQIDAAVKTCYTATQHTWSVIPQFQSKAAMVEWIIEKSIGIFKKTGDWDDVDKMKEICRDASVCLLPKAFAGDGTRESFFHQATLDYVSTTLDTRYGPFFGEHAECPDSHYIDFYSGQGKSPLKEASQMVQFNIDVDNVRYNSCEVYYQIRKHTTKGALLAKDEYSGLQFAKVLEKPTSSTDEVQLSDAEWDALDPNDIYCSMSRLIANNSSNSAKLRLINKCMSITRDNVGQDVYDSFVAALNYDTCQSLIDCNWVKFQTDTYKSALLLSGTCVIVEACPRNCDCQCGIGFDKNYLAGSRKSRWRENWLGKALMAIRHAFFVEERWGILNKPTVQDLRDAWDWRQPHGTCQLCSLSDDIEEPRGYPGFHQDPDFYKHEQQV
jgi:predicted NAD-dependent protein-ADP-ribosyltransferase YbiA (DUF1768 family)